MATTTSNGIELSYTDSGGDGRPVVLIHGWPLSGASWSEQVPALTAAGYRVITYDRRGFGASEKTGGGYDYDTFSEDLAGILDHLGVSDATLVGFSMGGGEVARYLGTRGSERIRSAVLASAVPPFLLKSDDNPDGGLADDDVEGMKAGFRDGRAEFLDGFSTNFFSAGDELKVTDEQRREAFALAEPAVDVAIETCIDAFSRTDFRDDLAKIDVPVLVIHGDSDGIVPFEVSGQRSHDAISDSTLHVVEGGPHGITVSHAEEFNDTLLQFLAD